MTPGLVPLLGRTCTLTQYLWTVGCLGLSSYVHMFKVTKIVLKKTAFICDIQREVETRLNASYLFVSEGSSWQVSPASIFIYFSASK